MSMLSVLFTDAKYLLLKSGKHISLRWFFADIDQSFRLRCIEVDDLSNSNI